MTFSAQGRSRSAGIRRWLRDERTVSRVYQGGRALIPLPERPRVSTSRTVPAATSNHTAAMAPPLLVRYRREALLTAVLRAFVRLAAGGGL